MNKRIYVGNLPFSSTEASLRELFGEHGDVVGTTIVADRETGRSRGFGFSSGRGLLVDHLRGLGRGQALEPGALGDQWPKQGDRASRQAAQPADASP